MSTIQDNGAGTLEPALEAELYNREADLKNLNDFKVQRGTPIPALFNIFFKFIQNPSTVSLETYKRMVDTDDTIGSGMDLLATLLAARLGSYEHPSDEITAWVTKAMGMMQGGFYEFLKELYSAPWAGFHVSEKCWANTDHGFIVERMAPLPPSSILFEVDRIGRLTKDGILQYQRAYNPILAATGGLYGSGFGGGRGNRPDPMAKYGDLPFPLRSGNQFQYLSIRIPAQKCVHYAFNAQGKFGNPYGRSLLRRGYNFWVLKNALLQMLANAMDRKGTPILVVYADPNATVIDQNKVSPGQNVRGQALAGIRPEQAALNAFANVHNESVIVLPGKKGQAFEVDPVQISANSADFIAAIDRCDRGLMRAMLIPPLIMNGGDGSGSYSLGQEHAKTFEKVLDGMNEGASQVLIDQYIKEMIMYNFPDTAWKKDGFGSFGRRDFSQDEVNKIMEGFKAMQDMGAIDMSNLEDLNKVRDTGGFSLRKEIMQPLDEMARSKWDNDLNGGGTNPPPDDEGQEVPPKGKDIAPSKENPDEGDGDPAKPPQPKKDKNNGLSRLGRDLLNSWRK